MSKAFFLIFFLVGIGHFLHGQTCTLSGSGLINWDNNASYSCSEGGTLSEASVMVIPEQITLSFDSNDDTWTGARIEVYGTMHISAPGQVTLNSNILVKNLASLFIDSKLNLGSSATGCDYTFLMESGGYFDIQNGAQNRLNICGNEIVKAGGGNCKEFPGSDLPYCEPSDGFPAPLSFNKEGASNYLLPVELKDFNALTKEGFVLLTWVTATETNNDFFTLERSENGVEYDELAIVEGRSNAETLQHYQFEDKQPLSGISYYRLKQTDLDGSTKVFRPVFVSSDRTEPPASLYPNPLTGDELTIFLPGFVAGEKYSVRIFTVSGVLVFEGKTIPSSGDPAIRCSVASLPGGAYTVALSAGEVHRRFRLIRK